MKLIGKLFINCLKFAKQKDSRMNWGFRKEFIESGSNVISKHVIQGTVEMGGKFGGKLFMKQIKK